MPVDLKNASFSYLNDCSYHNKWKGWGWKISFKMHCHNYWIIIILSCICSCSVALSVSQPKGLTIYDQRGQRKYRTRFFFLAEAFLKFFPWIVVVVIPSDWRMAFEIFYTSEGPLNFFSRFSLPPIINGRPLKLSWSAEWLHSNENRLNKSNEHLAFSPKNYSWYFPMQPPGAWIFLIDSFFSAECT